MVVLTVVIRFARSFAAFSGLAVFMYFALSSNLLESLEKVRTIAHLALPLGFGLVGAFLGTLGTVLMFSKNSSLGTPNLFLRSTEAAMGNLFFPLGGTTLFALALRKDKSVALSSSLIRLAFIILVRAMVGIAYFLVSGAIFGLWSAEIAAAATISILVLLVLGFHLIVPLAYRGVLGGFERSKLVASLISKLVVIDLAAITNFAFMLHYLGGVFGPSLAYDETFISAAVSTVISTIPVPPSALGTRELGIFFTLQSFGFVLGSVASLIVIQRVFSVVGMALLWAGSGVYSKVHRSS